MNCKRMIVFALLNFTLLLFFFSSLVEAQIWNIEFSPNLTPVVRKVSTIVQEKYLKDDETNKSISSSRDDNQKADQSMGIFKIYSGDGNMIDFAFSTSSSMLKTVGFSSIDDVHTAVAINQIGKVPNAPPVIIGSTLEDVIAVMGTPELIQSSPKAFKYRYSYIYFDDDWKVQSWNDKGNLKVSLEREREDLLPVDPGLFDEILNVEEMHPKEENLTTESKKTMDEMIEEFLEFLKN